MNTTTVATAVQRRWACHTRTVLPADAYGRQRCNVVLSACSVVYLWCMSWAVCSLARATKTDKNLAVRTYVQNKPHTEKPRKSSYPLPKKKNFDRPPRELQCSDRAQTSTTGWRYSCVLLHASGFCAERSRTATTTSADKCLVPVDAMGDESQVLSKATRHSSTAQMGVSHTHGVAC